MSRIGRLPVPVPAGVDVTIDGQDVTVKGPKGTLSRTISEPLSVTRQEDGSILVTRPDDERRSRSLHGLSRTLINNMVIGVTEGYSKQLEIVGTGYRVAAKGQGIELSLGFSHTVTVEPPRGHHLHGRRQPEDHRLRYLQGAGRRGRGEHSQDPSAGALQGQGRALRRRERAPQGRKGW